MSSRPRTLSSKLMVPSPLARWLLSFSPTPVTLGWPERFRSCLGALLGISFTAGVMHVLLGDHALIPLLVAPMGAPAVLLFAVPASPLAQPWSIIGGNIVSALIGVTWRTVTEAATPPAQGPTPRVAPTEDAWLAPPAAPGVITRKPSPSAPRAGRAPEDDPIPLGPVTFMLRALNP